MSLRGVGSQDQPKFSSDPTEAEGMERKPMPQKGSVTQAVDGGRNQELKCHAIWVQLWHIYENIRPIRESL